MAKEIILANVSNKLKKARKEAKLSQTDVARELGVSKQTIINYEANPINVRFGTLLMLAQLYGCEPSYFFTN